MKLNYSIGEVVWHSFAQKTLEEYDWSGNDLLKVVIYDLVERDKWEKGIGFVGWTGVGKTHLLISLYKERMWKAIYNEGQLPIWCGFNDAVAMWNEDKQELYEVISRGDIIFIDDIFFAGQNEVEKAVISEIVFKCYDYGKVLCWSSNILLRDMDVSERVKDRMKAMCQIVEVFGESRRGIK